MKKFLKLKYFFVIGIGVFLVILGFEVQDSYRKYGNYRTMQDPLSASESVDLTGLRELPYAGGPMIPLSELKKRLEHVKGPKIIVDGVHGKYGYVYGIPDSYIGYLEKAPSWKSYIWRLFYTGTLKSRPSLIVPGAVAAQLYGFEYRSFRIGSKYLSQDEDIDKFVSFLDALPENVSLYFHCIHGKGRTSMMLVMADIIKNAPKVALADIIKRQYLLGSVNLFDTASWTRSTYATKMLEDRKKFIEDFYDFIDQRKAGGIQRWSEWNKQRKGAIAVTKIHKDVLLRTLSHPGRGEKVGNEFNILLTYLSYQAPPWGKFENKKSLYDSTVRES
ncbi:MAG: hypothetical protein H0X26_00035 [Alphaproteobacteria bacterium]|nr:hypothetical protein [Alphaproteobacteria bacterium]